MATRGGAAAGFPSDEVNAIDSATTKATRSAAMKKIHFEIILERRWLATKTPEAVRRALLGAFACCVGSNAGDKDVEWGLEFLRVLAAEHLALPPTAVADVELLATGGWPEGEAPHHCFEGGRAGEWAEDWNARKQRSAAAAAATKSMSTATPSSSSVHERGEGEDAIKGDADDAESYRYSSAWERCFVEILARLVTSREYVAPARMALRRVAAAAEVSWRLLTVVEDELATMLKAARAVEECGERGGRGGGGAAASRSAEAGSGSKAAGGGDDDDGGGDKNSGGGGGGVEDSFSMGPLALPASGGGDGSSAGSILGKWLQVGGIATLGGVALVLTGGLAAPAVVGTIAALGATGGIIGVAAGGVAATLAAIGGTVGITIIFGASGAGLAGWKMARRTAGLTDFAFKPVRGEDTGLPVIIYAPGFHLLRHQFTHRQFTLSGMSGSDEPPNIFGCWGGDTGMFRALFVEEDAKIGWTLRDVEDAYGVNHATVIKVDAGSAAEAAGINVGAVVYELLTPEGMDWPVRCAEDAAVMIHKRPLMVYLRRCIPNPKYDCSAVLNIGAEEEAEEEKGEEAAAAGEADVPAESSGPHVSGGGGGGGGGGDGSGDGATLAVVARQRRRHGHEPMTIVDDLVISFDDEAPAADVGGDFPRLLQSEKYRDRFRQPTTVPGTARRPASSHLLRLETGFETSERSGSAGVGGGKDSKGDWGGSGSGTAAGQMGSGNESGLGSGFFGEGGHERNPTLGSGFLGSSGDDDGSTSASSEEEGMEMSAMRPMTSAQVPSETSSEKMARDGRSALPMAREREGDWARSSRKYPSPLF